MTNHQERNSTASRRKFLGGAAVAGVAAVTAPSVVKAQGPISMRFQSTWPSKDIFHEYALDFGKKVNDMTGGDLKIEVLPGRRGGAGVRPARRGVQRRARRRPRRARLSATAKTPRSRCGARAPATAWTPTCCWPGTSTAAARQLLEKIYTTIGADVVSFPYAPLLFAAARLVQEADAKRRRLQGPEIPHGRHLHRPVHRHGRRGQRAAGRRNRRGDRPRPARRGRIQQRLVRPRARLRRRVEDLHAAELPPERRAARDQLQQDEVRRAAGRRCRRIIDNGVEAASQDMQWKAIDRNSQDYITLQTQGQGEVLQDAGLDPAEAARALRRDHQEIRRHNPLFKEIIESQLAFAKRATQWEQDYIMHRKMAFDHYFGPNAKSPI